MCASEWETELIMGERRNGREETSSFLLKSLFRIWKVGLAAKRPVGQRGLDDRNTPVFMVAWMDGLFIIIHTKRIIKCQIAMFLIIEVLGDGEGSCGDSSVVAVLHRQIWPKQPKH